MNLNKFVVAHLNIISMKNKFEALIRNVSGEVDLLMISETKIDESFPKRSVGGGAGRGEGYQNPVCEFAKLPFTEPIK